MKKIFCLIALIAAMDSAAQCYNENRFMAFRGGYGTIDGLFMEIGAHPGEEQRFGYWLGLGMPISKIPNAKGGADVIFGAQAHARVQYRVNRYVHALATARTDFFTASISGGARLVLPLGKYSTSAIITDIEYGTRGAGISAGLAFGLQ